MYISNEFKAYEMEKYSHKIIFLAIEEEKDSLQHFKQNLTNAYKRELPALTFYSMEHPVLARCLVEIDL